MMMVLVYLAAIVLANLTVAWWGPGVAIFNAFLLIGLDLAARDTLHDRWKDGLIWKMGLLIGTGGLISFLLNSSAGIIAVASTAAFALAAVTDAVVYHLFRHKPYLIRANASNGPAALVDSLVFPTIAFGGFLPLITLGQFAAKVAGGFVWSLILKRFK
jgi:hypothetical protein